MKNKRDRRTIPIRTDPEFVKELRTLAKQRYFKNLEIKLPTDAEMIRLLRRTDGWKNSKSELEKKPRRENLI